MRRHAIVYAIYLILCVRILIEQKGWEGGRWDGRDGVLFSLGNILYFTFFGFSLQVFFAGFLTFLYYIVGSRKDGV